MSPVTDYINQLNAVGTAATLGLYIGSFVPGAIGLIFNVLIFTRPSLRREPCALYFLSATCLNLFVTVIIIPVRTVSNSFNLDLANYNVGICKVESFSFYATRATFCWLIALACFDRYLHSSANPAMRRLSSLKTARLTIIITSITIPLLYCHMVYYINIKISTGQNGNTVSQCIFENVTYRTFIALWHLSLYSICPSLIMLRFGSLTLNNIRKRRQILPRANENNRIMRRTNTQLLWMLLAQVLVIIILTSPYCIYQLYSLITANVTKDALRTAQENLASKITGVVSYYAHSSSFYLYTLTGAVFRKEFLKIIRQYGCLNRNMIAPTVIQTQPVSALPRNTQ